MEKVEEHEESQILANKFLESIKSAKHRLQRNQHERLFTVDYYKEACEVLLSIHDAEILTEVKKAIDCSGESLLDFIFDTLSSEYRIKLLSHIKAINNKYNSDYPPVLLTDVDDTLFASLIDRSFGMHQPYPGVSHLYHYITTKKKISFVAVLSARPKLMRSKTRGQLENGALKHTKFSVLDGEVIDLPSAIKGTSLDIFTAILGLPATDRKECYMKMANTKFLNYSRYCLIYPEMKFIFFGDSGQGDVDTALLMCTNPQTTCSFIHDLRPGGFTGKSLLEEADRSLLEKQNIFVFDHHCDILSNKQMKKFLTADEINLIFDKVEEEWKDEHELRNHWTELKKSAHSREDKEDIAGPDDQKHHDGESEKSTKKHTSIIKTKKCVIL
ncbi:AKT1 [Acrasis kona]|uniref:AKT1 n=1 Tax=Acrasis kona TaxID=1008807 RepID=A0AAW2ZLH0_9EUKA